MVKKRPRQIFRPHPVLGYALTPNSQIVVPFRKDIRQNISSDGWRRVPEAEGETDLNLAVYGCSFTYGTGLADNETFTAELQRALPNVRIHNRGVGGFGTVQNYLQFRQDIKNKAVDYAVFVIISDHRFRNIVHPQRMQQHLKAEWYELGVEHVPKVSHERDGPMKIKYINIWQPRAFKKDFDIFLPDDFFIDTATATVLSSILTLGEENDIPVQFVLLDKLDVEFNNFIMSKFTGVIDASTPFDTAHTFMPANIHPNVAANKLFASRLLPKVKETCASLRAAKEFG